MSRRALRIAAGFLVLAALGVLIAPRVLPSILTYWRPDIWFSAPASQRQLFVTIDDAPSRNTGEILRVLKKHGVPAMFFVISDRVKQPNQLEEIVGSGHALGNHLRTTRACSKLTLPEFQSDFDECAGILKRYTRLRFFRPASDFGTKEQMAYVRAQGVQPVMGTIFPFDHWISDPGWLVRIARWEAVPGGIVILHDGDTRGRTTAMVLDRLIPTWKAAGYSFGSLDTVSGPVER